MKLVDGRRLTGPNHLARTPLVVVEVAFGEVESLDSALETFAGQLARMREALGLLDTVELVVRAHEGGAVFAYAAPRDLMLPCLAVSEWAAQNERELEPWRARFSKMLQDARNPRWLAVLAEAEQRGVPVLWDDDVTTLGHAAHAVTFPNTAPPASVPWGSLGRVPVALVSGTNGKTTSSRLLAHVAAAAGMVVGSTSTDGVRIGDEILERGDWTGPIAARLVLRDPRVELAVLETARGGILRRGLAVDSCDAALLTNVTDDHLHDYGIDDVASMAQVKGVVADAVRAGGVVALNAHDARLRALRPAATIAWYADLDRGDADANATVAAHGGPVTVLRGGVIVGLGLRLGDVPLTFAGAAPYNVENVLGVVAVARGLGISDEAIARGLRSFTMKDNPGRGQVLEKNGVKILLDFGHNPAGVRAVLRLAKTMQPTGKLVVVAGSPGDRGDADVEAVVREIAAHTPRHLIVRELGDYLRGRSLGEVPAIYERTFAELGFPSEVYELAESEVDALRRALSYTSPGDLVVLLSHVDQDAVQELLAT